MQADKLLVKQEIARGDSDVAKMRLAIIEHIPIISITSKAEELAKNLLLKKAIPDNSEEDALHIGIAAVAGIDFLLTWNFKHINNVYTKIAITSVIETHGFICPILCSPEELGVNI